MTITVTDNNRSKKYYANLPALTTQSSLEAQTIPNNETWEITEVFTSVPSDELSYAAIYFGTELIFSSYSDRIVRLNRSIIGNGVLQLILELKNSQIIEMPMGIEYTARKL
jgi:hypothetical protein